MLRDVALRATLLGMRFAIIALALLLPTPGAWQHTPQDQGLHDRFYSTWKMPQPRDASGERINSCCSNIDCYPTTFKQVGGTWFAQQRETGKWIVIPVQRLEQNQPDPRDSPDGHGHLCANPNGMVYCAVLGVQG